MKTGKTAGSTPPVERIVKPSWLWLRLLPLAALLLGAPAWALVTVNQCSASAHADSQDFLAPPSQSDTNNVPCNASGAASAPANVTVPGLLGVQLDSSAGSSITSSAVGDTLSAGGQGSFSILHHAPDPHLRQNQVSHANANSSLNFCVAVASSAVFSISGQIQASGAKFNGNPYAEGSVGGLGLGVDFAVGVNVTDSSGRALPASGADSGSFTLQAGDCISAGAAIGINFVSPNVCSNCSNPVDPLQSPPSANGSYSWNLSVSPQPTGNTFLWVGPSVEDFGTPSNWQANSVPANGDTAEFRNRGPTIVDLGGASGTPCSSPSQTIARLDVVNVNGLMPVNGTLEMASLSPGNPSLTVENGGVVDIGNSTLCARHALVGNGTGVSEVTVRSPTGSFETTGTLSVGGSGAGLLTIEQGASALSQEVRLGDGGAKGTAIVKDAASSWQTGNMAVGFLSGGDLIVENGASLATQNAFIDQLLPGPLPANGLPTSPCIGRQGNSGNASIRGAGSTMQINGTSLDIGPQGCLEVTQQGHVEATAGVVRVGDRQTGEAQMHVSNGGILNAFLLGLGGLGPGRIILSESGGSQINVTDTIIIGGDHDGLVSVKGDTGVTQPSLVSDFLRVGLGTALGFLGLDPGSNILTNTNAEIGLTANGGPALVTVNGGSTGAPQPDTTWLIGQSLDIRSTGQLQVNGNSRVEVGSVSSPGQVTIEAGGSLIGNGSFVSNTVGTLRTHAGTLTNHGTIRGPLSIEGNYDPASTGTITGLILFLPPSPFSVSSASPQYATSKAKPQPSLVQGPVVITGDADLSGTTLDLQFGDGFAPAQGDTFQVVDVQGVATGNFAQVNISGLAPGADFDVVSQPGLATSLNDAVALPLVKLTGAKVPKLKEKQKAGIKLQFTRTGSTAAPITVNYNIGGTATNGIDYVTLPGALTIPAKKKSATLVIKPYADGAFEPTETVEIELLPGAGYSPSVASNKVTIQLSDK